MVVDAQLQTILAGGGSRNGCSNSVAWHGATKPGVQQRHRNTICDCGIGVPACQHDGLAGFHDVARKADYEDQQIADCRSGKYRV